jgi:histidine ammonia-lyase
MFSGMMVSQYTAGALVCENRVLSTPAATGSIPAAADQEDFVSMGMTTAIKTRQIVENSWQVIAVELMAAAQAFDLLTPLRPAPATRAAYDAIRKHIPKLEEDRPLHIDINALAKVAKQGDILTAVEEEIGKLN